jgi:hypothetical protein
MRSPNYPAIGLGEAIASAQQLWDTEKRTAVDLNTIAAAWGYSSVSGRVRSKIGALRKYGLLEDATGGTRISELGMKIVHGLPNSEDYTAALLPDLFRELFESYRDASDQAIKSYLILKRQFGDIGASEATKAFRETVEVAKLDSGEYTPSSDTVANGGTMTLATAPSIDQRQGGSLLPLDRQETMAFRWLIGNGVVAEVRLIGNEIKPGHLDMLGQQLQLTKKALEMDSEGEN